MTLVTLRDLIRIIGGWPFDTTGVERLLLRADLVLRDHGGRAYSGPLTDAELRALLDGLDQPGA